MSERVVAKQQTAQLSREVTVRLPLWGWGVAVLLLCLAVGAGFAIMNRQQRELQLAAEGVWIDHKSGLMWAIKDNGKDVSWYDAAQYCSNLQLYGGRGDWSMPDGLEAVSLWNGEPPQPNEVAGLNEHIQIGNASMKTMVWTSLLMQHSTATTTEVLALPARGGFMASFSATEPRARALCKRYEKGCCKLQLHVRDEESRGRPPLSWRIRQWFHHHG